MLYKVYCACLPHLFHMGLVLALFFAAYILYRVLFSVLKRIGRRPLAKAVITKIRRPTFWLFMESSALLSLTVFSFPAGLSAILSKTFAVLLILTAGCGVGRALNALFQQTIDTFKSDEKKRSSVIQVQFVARLTLVVIIFLTLAAMLLLFPATAKQGFGLLGSAGVAGIVIGLAARPIFLNLIAGFQIALTKTINLDDALFIDGEFGRVESIHLTYVVVRTWDLRRLIIPISDFIDKKFQNWDLVDKEMLGSVFLYLDYKAPVERIREKFAELVESAPQYNGNVYKLHVVEMTPQTMQLRLIMTGNDASSTFELRCFVREKLIEFLQREYPQVLPLSRKVDVPEEIG